MNSARIVSVIFDVKTEAKRSRFNVPRSVTSLLGLMSKDEIALVIRERNSRKPLWAGTLTLKSGTEIYGADSVSKKLRPSQHIRVEASVVPDDLQSG